MNLRRMNMFPREIILVQRYFASFTEGATDKAKNLLPFGANFSLQSNLHFRKDLESSETSSCFSLSLKKSGLNICVYPFTLRNKLIVAVIWC